MSGILVVVFNGESMLEFDRSVPLTEAQRTYMWKLDERMDQGVTLGEAVIAGPNPVQRAQYMALQLFRAVQDGAEAEAAAACGWLATRLPELKQVRGEARQASLEIALVFDRDYVPEVRVNLQGIKLNG